MKFLVGFAVLCTLIAVGRANLADSVSSCDDTTPTPIEVFVDGCEATPCHVANGDTVNFQFVFLPVRDSDNLTANVNIVLGPLAIPFELSEEDTNACNGLKEGSACPIVANERTTYGLGMTVEAPIVGVTVTLEFYLTDSTGERTVCMMYDQTIV